MVLPFGTPVVHVPAISRFISLRCTSRVPRRSASTASISPLTLARHRRNLATSRTFRTKSGEGHCPLFLMHLGGPTPFSVCDVPHTQLAWSEWRRSHVCFRCVGAMTTTVLSRFLATDSLFDYLKLADTVLSPGASEKTRAQGEALLECYALEIALLSQVACGRPCRGTFGERQIYHGCGARLVHTRSAENFPDGSTLTVASVTIAGFCALTTGTK